MTLKELIEIMPDSEPIVIMQNGIEIFKGYVFMLRRQLTDLAAEPVKQINAIFEIYTEKPLKEELPTYEMAIGKVTYNYQLVTLAGS